MAWRDQQYHPFLSLCFALAVAKEWANRMSFILSGPRSSYMVIEVKARQRTTQQKLVFVGGYRGGGGQRQRPISPRA